MKLLIIDNETPIRQGLQLLINQWCPAISEVYEATGVASGLQSIHQLQPDIVLLDVEMDDGTGFDLVRQLRDPRFQLIFITAHNQYALQAFRCAAIDFLLKPINPVELKEAVDRAEKNIRQHVLTEQLQVLLQQPTKRLPENKIVLKDINSTYFVKVNDILFCEAEGTYTKFHFVNSAPILVSKNLKEYETILEPMGFIRTHHSYLANASRITMYDKTDGGSLVFEGGLSIPVSQRKKEYVLQMLASM